MGIKEAVRRLYYGVTTNELRLMNQNTAYPNISYHSLLYLDLIDMTKHCTVSLLAELMQVSKPAVTLKVNELLSQGLVRKIQSSRDKRVNFLEVSDAVKADYRKYDKRLSHAISTMEKNHSPEEIEAFIRMLDEIGKEYLTDED